MKRILSCSMFIALAACNSGGGGGSNNNGTPAPVSTNSDGSCTQKFVDDINSYLNSCRQFSQNATVENGDSMIAVCDRFTGAHASSVDCIAESPFSSSTDEHTKACFGFGKNDSVPYGRVSVKAATVHQVCGLVKAKISEMKNKTPTPVPTPKPEEKPAPAKQVLMKDHAASEISVRVMDSKEAGRLYSNPDLVVVDGQIGSIESQASKITSRKYAVCNLTVTSEVLSKLEDDQVLKVLLKEEKKARLDRNQIIFILDDGTTGLSCINLTGDDFKLEDINEAFKGIFEVQVN